MNFPSSKFSLIGEWSIVLQIFWDFDKRPFNRGWPLNEGPLNGGSTV
jgi:hypothetical protein